jgi:hypothetical protein
MTCYDCAKYRYKFEWCEKYNTSMRPDDCCHKPESILDKPVPPWMEYAIVASGLFIFFSAAAYFVDLELLAPLVILVIYRWLREATR